VKVIRPNCRVQFTAEDARFITSTLGRDEGNAASLSGFIVAGGDDLDLILDDDKLLRALLEDGNCLRVSSHFYFYVLVRTVLRRAGVTGREVADYVASLLVEFTRHERTHCPAPGTVKPLEYFFEMVAALRASEGLHAFQVRAHIGNLALFLCGLYPERIRARANRRGFPDLSYYEGLGRASFDTASNDRFASRYALDEVFGTLAEQFRPARLALNDLSERLVSLGEPASTAMQPPRRPERN
jgi:hypothetical protein